MINPTISPAFFFFFDVWNPGFGSLMTPSDRLVKTPSDSSRHGGVEYVFRLRLGRCTVNAGQGLHLILLCRIPIPLLWIPELRLGRRRPLRRQGFGLFIARKYLLTRSLVVGERARSRQISRTIALSQSDQPEFYLLRAGPEEREPSPEPRHRAPLRRQLSHPEPEMHVRPRPEDERWPGPGRLPFYYSVSLTAALHISLSAHYLALN